MLSPKSIIFSFASMAILSIFLLLPQQLSAHCDGLDSPAVKASRKALETGNINLIPIWVQKLHLAQ